MYVAKNWGIKDCMDQHEKSMSMNKELPDISSRYQRACELISMFWVLSRGGVFDYELDDLLNLTARHLVRMTYKGKGLTYHQRQRKIENIVNELKPDAEALLAGSIPILDFLTWSFHNGAYVFCSSKSAQELPEGLFKRLAGSPKVQAYLTAEDRPMPEEWQGAPELMGRLIEEIVGIPMELDAEYIEQMNWRKARWMERQVKRKDLKSTQVILGLAA